MSSNARNLSLRSLHVENFKKLKRLDIDLRPFNLLVGPNNSGKSTLLQACSLFDSCYRFTLERRNGSLGFANRSLGPEEFVAVPAADPGDLWYLRKTQKGNDAVPIRVGGVFVSGERYDFELVYRFNRFSVRALETSSPARSLDGFGITMVPGFAGFLPKEEKRTPALVRDLKAQAQHGSVIRNLLLDLRQSSTQWQAFKEILSQAFPTIALNEAEFDEQVDRYIRATYLESSTTGTPEKSRRRPQAEFDLFSAGSGFHQFVQIFAGVFAANASTILLDEPDAHLFSRLQSTLYGVLLKLVASGRQVIAASHSPELIAASTPDEIVSFANGSPRRLSVRVETISTVRSLGALENLSLLLIDAYDRVVIVEDGSDEDYLRSWMARLLPPAEWAEVQSRVVFLHAHGRPTGDKVNAMLEAIRGVFSPERKLKIRAYVVADRDYRLAAELEAERKKLAGAAFRNQTWHVWERAEIENYLLLPRTITQLVQVGFDETPILRPAEETVLKVIEEAIEDGRDVVRDQLMNSFGRFSREAKHHWEPSTILKKAEALLASEWRGDKRLLWCEAKESVLPRLRRMVATKWDKALSDREIIRQALLVEVPQDLKDAVEALSGFVLKPLG